MSPPCPAAVDGSIGWLMSTLGYCAAPVVPLRGDRRHPEAAPRRRSHLNVVVDSSHGSRARPDGASRHARRRVRRGARARRHAALACGAAKHASATKRGSEGRAPLVIGDSVLLGACLRSPARASKSTRVAAGRCAGAAAHRVAPPREDAAALRRPRARRERLDPREPDPRGAEARRARPHPRARDAARARRRRELRRARDPRGRPALPRPHPRARLGALQRRPRRLVRRRRAAPRSRRREGLARLLRRALPLAIAPLCP